MKVVREDDGSLHATAETVPSGKKMLFLPLPGGEDRFSVVHDTQTSLFWMVTSQPTDSMRRRDLGGSLVAGRDRLALYFSRGISSIGVSPVPSRPRMPAVSFTMP